MSVSIEHNLAVTKRYHANWLDVSPASRRAGDCGRAVTQGRSADRVRSPLRISIPLSRCRPRSSRITAGWRSAGGDPGGVRGLAGCRHDVRAIGRGSRGSRRTPRSTFFVGCRPDWRQERHAVPRGDYAALTCASIRSNALPGARRRGRGGVPYEPVAQGLCLWHLGADGRLAERCRHARRRIWRMRLPNRGSTRLKVTGGEGTRGSWWGFHRAPPRDGESAARPAMRATLRSQRLAESVGFRRLADVIAVTL